MKVDSFVKFNPEQFRLCSQTPWRHGRPMASSSSAKALAQAQKALDLATKAMQVARAGGESPRQLDDTPKPLRSPRRSAAPKSLPEGAKRRRQEKQPDVIGAEPRGLCGEGPPGGRGDGNAAIAAAAAAPTDVPCPPGGPPPRALIMAAALPWISDFMQDHSFTAGEVALVTGVLQDVVNSAV